MSFVDFQFQGLVLSPETPTEPQLPFLGCNQARNMAHVWKGRRTGLMIDDAQVTKDVDGLDNIESFWESACLGA